MFVGEWGIEAIDDDSVVADCDQSSRRLRTDSARSSIERLFDVGTHDTPFGG